MLRLLHRWLGLTIGLVLVVTSLSGSWLIYNREWRSPEFVVEVETQTISLEQLYKIALTEIGTSGGIVIRYPQSQELPYQFWAINDGHERVFINQYTGDILAKYKPDYWPYGWAFELHTELLDGHQGETALGFFGLLALIIVLTGVILWLPKRGQRISKHLKIRLNKSNYVRNFDLHRHIGILAAPVLIITLMTGITLVFNKEFGLLVNSLTNSQVTKAPKPLISNNLSRVNLDSILETANTIMPGGRVGIIIVPTDNKPIVVRKQMQDDPHPNGLNFIHIDATSGKLLQVIPVSQADTARKLFNWIYPLHTGQIFNDWYDLILFALGLVPALMLFTASMTFYLRNNFTTRLKQQQKS
jgi:uncharacterized iron-regulated membrane protein